MTAKKRPPFGILGLDNVRTKSVALKLVQLLFLLRRGPRFEGRIFSSLPPGGMGIRRALGPGQECAVSSVLCL